MGVDFINRTKPAWRKGWNKQKQRLAIRQLFSSPPQRAQTIGVRPYKVSDFREHKAYELQVELDRIFVYDKGRNIGVCTAPPRYLVREIASLGGKTLGAIRKAKVVNEQIELMVVLPSTSDKGLTKNERLRSKHLSLP